MRQSDAALRSIYATIVAVGQLRTLRTDVFPDNISGGIPDRTAVPVSRIDHRRRHVSECRDHQLHRSQRTARQSHRSHAHRRHHVPATYHMGGGSHDQASPHVAAHHALRTHHRYRSIGSRYSRRNSVILHVGRLQDHQRPVSRKCRQEPADSHRPLRQDTSIPRNIGRIHLQRHVGAHRLRPRNLRDGDRRNRPRPQLRHSRLQPATPRLGSGRHAAP